MKPDYKMNSILIGLDRESNFERKALFKAFFAGIITHAVIIVMAGLPGAVSQPEYTTLAVMDFSEFDPLGGQGGDGGVPAEGLNAGEAEPEPEPVIEPEQEPEPELAPEPEDFTLLESLAEAAEPTAVHVPPPQGEKPKPAEKPKPRLKPKPSPAPRAGTSAAAQGSGGGLAGTSGTGGSGPGGTPGGTGTGNPNEMNAYKGKVRQRLERRKKYPNSAQSRGLAGTATVSFVVARDGSVHSTSLVSSSGSSVLDDEAVALPSRCSPMPPLPGGFTGASLKLTVPIRFSVR
jgi:protein TonB